MSGTVVALGVALAAILTLLSQWSRRRRELESLRRAGRELDEIARGDRQELTTTESLPGPVASAVRDAAASVRRQRVLFDERRHLLLEIVNGMGEGVLAIDARKRIVLANDRLRSLFGIDQSRSGRLFYEVIRNARVIEAFDRALEGNLVVERTSLGVGGEDRQIEVRVFPVRESTEIAAVALLIDITRLERLSRTRRDFIADFSHEVRTPLAGLRSAIETLRGGALDSEQEIQLEGIVERQLGRLERLVSDLAELNSIESGEMALHCEPTEIRQLITDLAGDFFENVGRKIAIVVDGDSSVANVDPIRIEQVFANLIDNAIKHAPESDEVRIEVIDSESEAEVRVSDRGPGIPKQELNKVFHRFYRVDRSRSNDSPGTGLGLAIAKHLILSHGGSVVVESDLGHGSTFIVRLPKRAEARP